MSELNRFKVEKTEIQQEIEYLKKQVENECLLKNNAEERATILENEKLDLEMELNENKMQFLTKTKDSDIVIELLRSKENELTRTVDLLKKQNTELTNANQKLSTAAEHYDKEYETLTKQYQQEKLFKETAINKLAEVMNRRDMKMNDKKDKTSIVIELKKKEKECRKLQQDLNFEREACNQKIALAHRECNEIQASLQEETQQKVRLQMELAAKEQELEQLRRKTMSRPSEENLSTSSTSIIDTNNQTISGNYEEMEARDNLEGWLSIPYKQNKRRHTWRKQYVVLSNRKIIFYNNEQDKAKHDASLILDLR